MWFCSKKLKLDEACAFWAKSCLWNSHELTYPWPFLRLGAHETQKVEFSSKVDFGPIIQFWSRKVKSDAKSEILSENAFLRPHVADAYKPNGILTKMGAFFAQSRFLGQKCVLDPKIDFWTQNRKLGPKGDFGPKSALFRKSDQKVNVELSVAEPGSPASGPDRIHAQPGLPELVAFSVPLHSNQVW